MSGHTGMTDHGYLESALVDLAGALEWPEPADLHHRVVARLDAVPPGRLARLRRVWATVPRVRRVAFAVVVLALLLAAAAAAVTWLAPGVGLLRLPAGATLPPAASPARPASLLGDDLGLGTHVPPARAADLASVPLLLPGGEAGPPDAAWVAVDRVHLVWRASPALPEIDATGIGLIVTELRGRVDEGWYEKLVVEGSSRVEEVEVDGAPAWWITGEPHQLVYRDSRGRAVEETRRMVGDVLIWRGDGVTLRMESALGREATIRLAETVAPR